MNKYVFWPFLLIVNGNVAAKGTDVQRLSPDLKRAYGEATFWTRDWHQSEELLRSLSRPPEDPYQVEELLCEITERYHHHMGPEFRRRKLPGDEIIQSGLTYRGFPGQHVGVKAVAVHGLYKVMNTGPAISGDHGYFKVFGQKPYPFRYGVIVGGASSDWRDTFSPGLFLDYDVEEKWVFKSHYRLNHPWDDSAQAVRAGTTEDDFHASLELRSPRFPRISAQMRSDNSHYETRTGETAKRRRWVPETHAVLLHVPFVGLGYQYFKEDVTGTVGFFPEVPLLQKVRTHYLSLTLAARLKPCRLSVEANFYNGHDDSRNLKFGNGDLFGMSFRLDGILWKRLHLTPSYEYNRESSGGVAGQSHVTSLRLEWHGRGK